jgi:hypothetical protein
MAGILRSPILGTPLFNTRLLPCLIDNYILLGGLTGCILFSPNNTTEVGGSAVILSTQCLLIMA